MPEVGSIEIRIAAKTRELVDGVDESTRKLKDLGTQTTNLRQKMETLGRSMSSVGAELSKAVTLPLAALGGTALKTSIDFESAFAGVRKTVDATEEEFAELRDGILEMSKRIPAAQTSIAGVAEAAGQLGIQVPNILDFTEVMTNLGVTTNMTAEDAATALARFANIVQMPQTAFDRLGSTIVDLGNNLATTEAEIVEMSLRIAGAGAQVGLAESEIMGLAGALSSVGIRADAGGTAISKVMIAIASEVAKGSEKMEAFASVAGMAPEAFARSFEEDAAGTIIRFVEGLGNIGAGGVSVFDALGGADFIGDEFAQALEDSGIGDNLFAVLEDLGFREIRVRDALLRMSGAGDVLRNSIELGRDAWEENTALVQEAEQRYRTTASQLDMLLNKLKDVSITLGDSLTPILLDLVDAAQPFIDMLKAGAEWFAALDPQMQVAIVTFGGLAAAIGPVALALGTVIAGLGVLAGPAGWAVLGAVGAALGIAFWPDIEESLGGFEGFSNVIDSITSAFEPLKELMTIVLDIAKETGEAFLPLFDIAWDAFAGTLEGAFTILRGVLEIVVGILQGNLPDALDGVETVLQGFETVIASVLNIIIDSVNLVIRALNTVSVKVPDWVPLLGGKEFGISIPEIPRLGLQSGALIPGTGGPDSIAALLAPGEAITPYSVWSRGPEALVAWFRAMGAPGYQTGGIITPYSGPALSDVDPQNAAQVFAAIMRRPDIVASAFSEEVNRLVAAGETFADAFLTVARDVLARVTPVDVLSSESLFESVHLAMEGTVAPGTWLVEQTVDDVIEKWIRTGPSPLEAMAQHGILDMDAIREFVGHTALMAMAAGFLGMTPMKEDFRWNAAEKWRGQYVYGEDQIYYSNRMAASTPPHEQTHREQFYRGGQDASVLYDLFDRTVGYPDNPFETEAQEIASRALMSFEALLAWSEAFPAVRRDLEEILRQVRVQWFSPSEFIDFRGHIIDPAVLRMEGIDPDLVPGLPRGRTGSLLDLIHEFTGGRVRGFRRGGILSGFGGGDRRLALLEDGEAIIPKESVSANLGVVRDLIPGMQTGGIVGGGRGRGSGATSNLDAAAIAITGVLNELASRLSEFDRGLGDVVRSLRWSTEGGRLQFDQSSLIASAISLGFETLFDIMNSNAEIERRIAAVPDPGTDVLGVAQTFANFENLNRNIAERERRIRELQQQQQAIATGTAVGGAIGAGIGALFGPIGILAGLLIGGGVSRKVSTDTFGPQIAETEEQIRALEAQIQNARVNLIDVLGIAADDFARGISGAFEAADVSEFGDRLGQNIRDQIRQAMIQVFIAQILEPQITELAEMVQSAFLDGTQLDMDVINARIEGITEISRQLYDRFDELGLTVEKTDRAMQSMSRNIPTGYKVAQPAFQVARPIDTALPGTVGTGATSGMKQEVTIHVPVTIHGPLMGTSENEVKRWVQEAAAEGLEQAGIGSTGLRIQYMRG